MIQVLYMAMGCLSVYCSVRMTAAVKVRTWSRKSFLACWTFLARKNVLVCLIYLGNLNFFWPYDLFEACENCSLQQASLKALQYIPAPTEWVRWSNLLNAPPGRDYCNILPGQPALSNRMTSVKSIGTLCAPELFISAMLQCPNRHVVVSIGLPKKQRNTLPW